MATALPPEVDGPITPASKQVLVDNVLPQSLVTVYADGSPVGTAISTNPGWIFVPLTKTLVEGQEITATQNCKDPDIPMTSGESDPSAPVQVQKVPAPLPPLVFLSGLSACMDSVLIGGSDNGHGGRHSPGKHLRPASG